MILYLEYCNLKSFWNFFISGISYTDRPAFENFNSWTEGQETSDSDKLEQEDEEDSLRSNVQFIVGASEYAFFTFV